jgi:potassium-transporting ATPase KdpC subunit
MQRTFFFDGLDMQMCTSRLREGCVMVQQQQEKLGKKEKEKLSVRGLSDRSSTRQAISTRPSHAGAGYDATSSSGSNYGPTNKVLIDRVRGDVQKLRADNSNRDVPVDLVTTSGSGLDPDISPAAAEFQITHVALERKLSEAELRALVRTHTQGRQLGFLGEPRLNVLELNLDLDTRHPL